MRYLRRICLIILLAMSICTLLNAQFYNSGNENGLRRWSSISSPNFQIIYPTGLDSLGRVCAIELEKASRPIAGNIGWGPNECYRRPLSVVLHPYAAYNNGFVSWCPRRMEFILGYDAYDRISLPQLQELAIHEGRHAAQMQLGASRLPAFNIGNVLVGEMLSGALAAIYGGPAFLEGDAVVAETAITQGGRGRSADFLEYMRASFDEGEYRNFWRWRYGSQRLYTPDHYRIGYLMEAGVRTFWDDPDFTKRFYDNIADCQGFSFFNYNKTIKQSTKLGLRDSFMEVAHRADSIWRKEADSRAPYTPVNDFTEERKYYTQYLSPCRVGDYIYTIRRSLDRSSTLVKFSLDGNIVSEYPFASECSRLQYSPSTQRIFWSEYKAHPRWEMESSSEIRYLDSLGIKRTLIGGRKLYNPAVCKTSELIAAIVDPSDGSSHIEVFSAIDGESLRKIPSQDGMEMVECCWIGDELYFSAVTRDGFGLYRESDMQCILSPKHVKIKQLREDEGSLVFVCDRSGANELYRLENDKMLRLTSSRIGSSEYLFDGDSLYLSQPSSRGRMLKRVHRDSLSRIAEDWSRGGNFPIAQALSEGEKLAYNDSINIQLSEVTRYNKLKNMFRLHSWAPVYFDIDQASSISMQTLSQVASPGAVVFSQNTLSTLQGWAGVKLLDDNWHWRPSAHLKLSYSGLYPVFELKLDYNDHDRRLYRIVRVEEDGKKYLKSKTGYDGLSSLSGTLNCYVPLKYNSGGWLRGLIPQLSVSLSNNAYSHTIASQDVEVADYSFVGRTSLNIRAYSMLPVASSCIYPRLGLGINMGYGTRPGLKDFFGDKVYFHSYAYLPGFYTTHGIKLSLITQKELGDALFGESYMQVMPRGCSYNARVMATRYSSATRFSVDYAIPFASVDWDGLCPITYLRNFEMIPFFELTRLSGSSNKSMPKQCYAMSAGTTISAVLGNLLWIPYDTRIGVNVAYVHEGSLNERKLPIDISLVFEIDL